MSGQDHRAGDSHFSKWMGSITPLEDHVEIVQLSAVRARATDEAGAAIARQLNGPLTALLLYMNEIKQHSHQFSQAPGNRAYLQQVVENALQQTERVCAMVKQMSTNHPASDPDNKSGTESLAVRGRDADRKPRLMFAPESGQKPLTRREREGAEPDQRRVLQQAGRLADEHQPKDLREPSRRGHAQARRPQYRGSRAQGAAAARLISASRRDGHTRLNARDLNVPIYRIADCRAKQRDRPFFRSAEIFRERANARRGPREDGRLGFFRNDGDGPRRRGARLVFHDRSNVADDCRSGRTRGYGPAIELGHTETPHFFLVACLKREHEGLPWSRSLSSVNLIRP